ncbi:MAG: DUF3991 domain-containing protein [Xenococcaceae cyanobacterium MO_167.B27]|nr:DUF3991 domain-containing protein [Xenococcaceae cyanobacterium MO_167.B27]
MYLNNCDFKESVAWLNDRFGEGVTIEAVTYKTREIIKEKPVLEFTPPVPSESKWQEVRKYLTRTLLLPSGLVDSLHELGLIYADEKQNAVRAKVALWMNQKSLSATLRGTAGEDNTFKGLAKGTKRSEGWFYFQQGGQFFRPDKQSSVSRVSHRCDVLCGVRS